MTIGEVLDSMKRGEITEEQAIKQLMGLGKSRAVAGELVSIQKFGTDIFEVDEATGERKPVL